MTHTSYDVILCKDIIWGADGLCLAEREFNSDPLPDMDNAIVGSSFYFINYMGVTVHTPLFREVFWHEYAKIPRHTSQNSIAAGNLE